MSRCVYCNPDGEKPPTVHLTYSHNTDPIDIDKAQLMQYGERNIK